MPVIDTPGSILITSLQVLATKEERVLQKPYVGVTGFMDSREVADVLEAVPANGGRQLMVGVLTSFETLRRQKNKRPGRYPETHLMNRIFPSDPRCLNLIHYATDVPETLYEQLILLTRRGGSHLHGFQLNIAWPPPQILERYRWVHQNIAIVLQVGRRAFEEVGDDPATLAEKVASEYRGLVEHVLLDPSGGRGEPFDPDTARACLDALAAKDLGIGLGVAGGFSATTLYRLEPLARDFPALSIDAEGKLRNQSDALDPTNARAYVTEALRIFSS